MPYETVYRVFLERSAKFGLEVVPEKTCIHRFSRFCPGRDIRLTFLGFEFYRENDTKGVARVWRRTARRKLQASIKACRSWVKPNRHVPLPKLIPTMIRKVRWHYNYFYACGNTSSLWIFYRETVRALNKWLNRRSQRRSLTWKGLKRVLTTYVFRAPTEYRPAKMNRGLA